jgi:S1-C subfamily serine protease
MEKQKKSYLGELTAILVLVSLFLGLVLLQEKEDVLARHFSLSASIFSFQQPAKEKVLSQEELVDLVKPSVVRVAQHITGEATIPAFDINIEESSVSILSNRPPMTVPLDVYITGSGFIVNPDGYIFTNAHVVSDQTIKQALVSSRVASVFLFKILGMSKEESSKIANDETATQEMLNKILKDAISKSTFKIEKTLAALNPSSDKEKLADQIQDGFPAAIVQINDNFADDDKDAALLKISKEKLPSMQIGSSASLTVGKKIYTFGFPATAEFNGKNLTEATFTQGTISAIKDSQNKDFKILQTDAKVSQGSSGSPLFDEKGLAVGLVTFQSSSSQTNAGGDNFAFAIPIEIAQKMLKQSFASYKEGSYWTHFQAGLSLLENRRCKKAIDEFNLAKETDKNFKVDKYLNPYIDKCTAMIASGQSIDTIWAEIWDWFKQIGYLSWVIMGAAILVFVALVFVIVRLLKRMKKEEEEINKLEDQVGMGNNHGAGGADAVAKQNLAVAPKINPQILEYIKSTRAAGFKDEEIYQELKKSNWSDEEIKKAMSS